MPKALRIYRCYKIPLGGGFSSLALDYLVLNVNNILLQGILPIFDKTLHAFATLLEIDVFSYLMSFKASEYNGVARTLKRLHTTKGDY